MAAKRGVDVRIITQGIPDKNSIFLLTQSYYERLIHAGVRIYQYTPGFIHAKQYLCDDEIAVVGTINMDFRSLYLHFECGAWLTDATCIADMKNDFEEIFRVSEPITEVHVSFFRRVFRGVLQLIAPLL